MYYSYKKFPKLIDSYVKIVSLKNQLSKDINFQKNENVIYFDFMRLVISIMKKYL